MFLSYVSSFFYWYGAHRDLHSFPTRRSSDLSGRTSSASCVYMLSAVMICFTLAVQLVRSEEHTSELQSQFHLVCRLLLEKKKIPALTITTAARPSVFA